MANGKSPEEGADEALASDGKATGPEDEEKQGDTDAAVDTEEESGESVAEAEEAEAEPPTVESLSTALSEAETKVAELQDQSLRAKAEVENVRRRAVRDVENAHKYALERMTAELLPVLDSMEKAVESVTLAENAVAIGEGVELSLKMFLAVLAKVGIEQLDPLGEPFDPQFHEAVAMVENPDGEPNSVMEVIQRGYSLNGRLVRAAKVVVVKGSSGEESSDVNVSA